MYNNMYMLLIVKSMWCKSEHILYEISILDSYTHMHTHNLYKNICQPDRCDKQNRGVYYMISVTYLADF